MQGRKRCEKNGDGTSSTENIKSGRDYTQSLLVELEHGDIDGDIDALLDPFFAAIVENDSADARVTQLFSRLLAKLEAGETWRLPERCRGQSDRPIVTVSKLANR